MKQRQYPTLDPGWREPTERHDMSTIHDVAVIEAVRCLFRALEALNKTRLSGAQPGSPWCLCERAITETMRLERIVALGNEGQRLSASDALDHWAATGEIPPMLRADE
jgi:hypothetical protein